MPRKNTVRRLDPRLRAEVDRLLAAGRHSLDQILEHLRALGEANPPSRSALGRYAQNFEKVAARLREGRETARALAQELGAQTLEDKQGRILVESMRTLVFDLMQTRLAMEEGIEPSVQEISLMARSVRELSQAIRMDQDFAARIREEERKKADEELKRRLTALGSAQDLKALSDAELERRIAGLAAD
jgi:hypothetical protein